MAWPQVEVVQGSDVFVTGIVVTGGTLKQPLQLLPFPAGHVRRAIAVAEDRVLATSNADGRVALIALPSGSTVATYDDGDRSSTACHDEILLTRDGRHVVLLGSWRVVVLERETLRLVQAWNTKARLPLTEISDGRIMAALWEMHGACRYGYYRFDIPTGEVERHVVFDGPENAQDDALGVLDDVTCGTFMGFSPTGRYALRRHYGAIPMAMRPAATFLPWRRGSPADPSSLSPYASHPDVRADGVNRFGIVVELWDIGHKARLLDKIVVRMVEAMHVVSFVHRDDGISERQLIEIARQTDLATSKPFEQSLQTARKPVAEPSRPWVWGVPKAQLEVMGLLEDFNDPGGDMRPWHLKFRWRALPDTLADVAWDADETGFWVRFNPHVIRRVGLDGSLSPLVAFERYASPQNPLTTVHQQFVMDDETEHVFVPLGHEPDNPYNQVTSGYNDMAMDRTGQGRLRLVSRSLGTVTWDPALLRGAPGQVVLVPQVLDQFTPIPVPPSQAAFDAFLRNLAALNQPVGADTEAGAIAALDALTERFASGVEALAFDGTIRIDFRVGDRVVEEQEFFARLVDRNWSGTVPALRRLLLTYLHGIEGGEGCTPWHNGHAIRALVLLDRGQQDVYRAYLQKRDGEHDRYPAEELYQEYAARHGYRGEDDIRFGAFVTINFIWGGVGGPDEVWRDSGLFQQARRLLSPSRFAQVLFEELQAFEPVEQQWDFQDGNYYLQALMEALDRTDRFQAATADALARLARA